jgi:tetratricopeptide (TPR) repeat protein
VDNSLRRVVASCTAWGAVGLVQNYTRREVSRILGLDTGRLRYWERLRLVQPRARWGERFYNFGDLVALRTLQRLTANRVPARRVRRALSLVEQQFGETSLPLQELRLVDHGRELLVFPPGTARPFDPIRRQWMLPFDGASRAAKLHCMVGRTPEELFESALVYESRPELLPLAIETYRHVVELSPNWIEAHINLGVACYQAGQLQEAREAFRTAVELDPLNGISRYNLGCTLEELGEVEEALDHLRRAARAMPANADVHFNLALAYEKRGERRQAREQWQLYLRYAPSGPWAEQARARLREYSGRRKSSALLAFPRKF